MHKYYLIPGLLILCIPIPSQEVRLVARKLVELLVVSTLQRKTVEVNLVYRSSRVKIGDNDLPVELLLFDFVDFDVILGLDYLSYHHASFHCHIKVNFTLPNKLEFQF